jgi:hypothetical protein
MDALLPYQDQSDTPHLPESGITHLEAVVTDLHADAGEQDDQARARLGEALSAAGHAYRKHLAGSADSAGHAA